MEKAMATTERVWTMAGNEMEPSFEGATDSFDDETKRERQVRFMASADMLFRMDDSKLDDIGAAALYRSVTEGLFGIPDEDGTVAFGSRASNDPHVNIDLLRRFVKGDYSLIEDPEYTKWRQMDEMAKFEYARKGESAWHALGSAFKGERGPSALEFITHAFTPAAMRFGPLRTEAEGEAQRRMRYEDLDDEEKAQYRANVIRDYDEKLSRRQTLATYLQVAQGLSDRAGYLLAKSFNDGVPDAANIETLPEDERDRVYSAFAMMRGDQRKGRILGIQTDFTDGTWLNRVQLGLYGFQQSAIGLVTDTAGFARDAALIAYAKCAMDEAERREFFRGWDANVRAEQAMRQSLPAADGTFGEAFQALAENAHWFIPYGMLIGKGAKMAKGARAAIEGAKLRKDVVVGMMDAGWGAGRAAGMSADLVGAAGKVAGGARALGGKTAAAGHLKRQLAMVDEYSKALRDISKAARVATRKEATGAAMWAVGEAEAFGAFASEYVADADAAGISREESVLTAVAVGLVNAKVERMYVPFLESSLTPVQVKALTFGALAQAVRSDGAAGFRRWFANRMAKGATEGAKVALTEGAVEEPLQQLAIEHGKAFDRLCQELRKDGKATLANEAQALWKSFAETLPDDYATFIDTAVDMVPSSLGFGVRAVGNMKLRQHLHNVFTRHANRRSKSTMVSAQTTDDLHGASDYDEGIVDYLQRAADVRTAVERFWKGDTEAKDGGKPKDGAEPKESGETKGDAEPKDGSSSRNGHSFEEAMTAARRAWRSPKTRDVVQEVADAAGVDVKTAEVVTQYLQAEAEATAFSPQARAWSSLNMSFADIDEATIRTVLPGYVEGSFASDPDAGVYSGRVRLGDGTERTIAYRVGDWSQIAKEYVEGQVGDGSSLGKSWDARIDESGGGMARWADLTSETRRAVALSSVNGVSTGKGGVFELTDAKGVKVRVNADDVILLANGRLADIGYGAAATQGTARHETFHSLWRFARATMDAKDVQALAGTFGIDVSKEGWEDSLDEAMAPQMERYASGHYVSHAVSSRLDRIANSWAGGVIRFFGRFAPSDEVRDPKTGRPYRLKGLYDRILRGEIGSGAMGVELRKVAARAEGVPAGKPKIPVKVTDGERAAHEAELRAEADAAAADEPEQAEGKSAQPQSPETQGQKANADESGATVQKVVHTAENPADASVPNQVHYRVGLPNSPVKLVGRLEVRDADAGVITSTDAEYHDRGNQNRDDGSEESRALVERIGAKPDPLQVGTVQPIASNGIAWILPNGDAIIGNHRLNGVRLAYGKGTAGELERFVREDAARRGIEIGADVKRPIPVFVLERIESPDGKADVHEVVRLANESQNRGFNVREQAANDAKVLLDNVLLPRMAFRADGRIDETRSADAIGTFRRETGAQGMVAEDGSLTEEGQTRILNAALAALLGGSGRNALLQKVMANAGHLDMAGELRALMRMTPELVSLAEAKPAYDLRGPLAEALQLFTEWRDADESARLEKGKSRHDWRETARDGHRIRGISWEAFISQGDMFRRPSDEARILGDLFARAESLRSFDREDVESAAGRRRVMDLITGYLADYAANARAVNTETEDMFGGTPASRADVLSAQRIRGGERGGARFSMAADPYGRGSSLANGAGFVDLEPGDTFGNLERKIAARVGEEVANAKLGITAKIGSKANASHLMHKTSHFGDEDAEAHKYAAKNVLALFAKARLAISHHDKKGTPNDYIRAFVPFAFADRTMLATITLRRDRAGDRLYSVESVETKTGSSPRSSRRTAQGAQLPVSIEDRIAYYVGDVNRTQPKFIGGNSNEEFSTEALVGKVNAEIGAQGGAARFSVRRITPEEDAAYVDAVKRGDTETAEKMKRDAVARAMPNTKVVGADGKPMKVYHGSRTGANIKIFRTPSFFSDNRDVADMFKKEADFILRVNGKEVAIDDVTARQIADELTRGDYTPDEMADWGSFAESIGDIEDNGKGYGGRDVIADALGGVGIDTPLDEITEMSFMRVPDIYECYVNITNPLEIDFKGKTWGQEGTREMEAAVRNAAKNGYDGVIVRNIREGGFLGELRNGEEPPLSTDYIPVSPNQIKLADAVTYDDADNVIPLSQRFNQQNPDIRFSADTGHLSDEERKNLAAAQAEVKGILGRVGGTLVGRHINSEFVREGRSLLIGKRVSSARDLAALAQVYRSPCFETFRYFFTKGGEIVWQTGVTARLPGISETTVNTPQENTYAEIGRMAAKLKPDGVWLLHNHPSGDIMPSGADCNVTRSLAGYFDRLGIEFGAHVVIDHDRYAWIDRDGMKRGAGISADGLDASYHGDPYADRLREPGEPFNLTTIANYAMGVQRDTDAPGKVLTLISIDSKGYYVTAVANVPTESIGGEDIDADDFFADWRGASGGAHLVIVGDQDIGSYPPEVRRVLLRQIRVGNATDFLFGEGTNWDSVRHRGEALPSVDEINRLVTRRTATVDDGQTRFSVRVNPRLREEIEAALNTDRAKGEVVKGGRHIIFCESPRLFAMIGIPHGTVYTKAYTLRKIAKEHSLTAEQIASTPELLERPAAVFDDNGEGYIVLTDALAFDLNGRNAPVMVYLRPDESGNFIASAYSRTENGEAKYANLSNAGRILYFDKDKVARLPLQGEAKSSLSTFNAGDDVKTPENLSSWSSARIVPQGGLGAQGGAARFSIGSLYTGSAADYERPSLHAVGTGEGSQVYGWGLYASNRRGVAEGYANSTARQLASTPDEMWPKYKGKFDSELEHDPVRTFALKYVAREGSVDAAIQYLRTDDWTESATPKAREAAAWLERNRGDVTPPQRPSSHLYEQTWFTDRAPGDESHLLNWYGPVSEEQLKWVKDASKEFSASDRAKFARVLAKPLGYNTRTQYGKKPLVFTGEDIYRAVTHVFRFGEARAGNPQKAASEFLARAGIDGVKYPVDSYGGKAVKDGDEAGWNYVSFRDDNIRVDHKWTDGQIRFSASKELVDAMRRREIATRLDRFFQPATGESRDVPLTSLFLLKDESDQSVRNAAKSMRLAADGETARRAPIAVVTRPDGSLVIVDGNATARALAASGATHARVRVVGKDRGTRFLNSAYLVDNISPSGPLLVEGATDLDRAIAIAVENADALAGIVRACAGKVGGKPFMRPVDAETGKPTKGRASAERKMLDEYDGDARRLVDMVGGTVVMEDDSDLADAVKAISRVAQRDGAEVVKVKKLNFGDGATGYQDVKVSVRFANGGIGEIILVNAYMNDAKFNRGGHDLYDVQRIIRSYTTKSGDTEVDRIHDELADLEEALYSRGESAPDGEAFARMYANASSSLQRLLGNVSLWRSSRDIKAVKSWSSGTHLAKPPSTSSYAMPALSLMKYTEDPLSDEIRNMLSENGRNLSHIHGGVNGENTKTRFSTEQPGSRLVYPMLSAMSDDQLLAASVAVRMALGKSDRVSDRAVRINTVQKAMRRLHPDWDGTRIGVESNRVMSEARELGKRIREDLDRGVSESLVLRHLPDTAREQFGHEMRQEARRGQSLGAFGQKVATEIEERQVRVVEDAVRVQTGIDASVIENAYGISLSATLMRLAENPLTQDDGKPLPPPVEVAGEGAGAGGGSASPTGERDISERVREAVDAIVEQSALQAKLREMDRRDRKLKAEDDRWKSAAKDVGAESKGGTSGGGGSPSGGVEDITAVATRKAGVDLRDPGHLAEFVAELARRYWIGEHGLALDADAWRDLVAVQFLRKTARSVYAKLCRDLTYSRGRETAMQRIARLDSIPTVKGLISEMEFVGALINANRIRESQKEMCRKLDLFLRQKFGAQGRFRPDREEGKRSVSAEAELRARYMRHAMWLTPDAAADEARELQRTLDSLSVDFREAGRDVDQSREFVDTIRKMNVLREFGALRYRPLGEIEAAARWWEDFARGEGEDIVREMSDRDIYTKKASDLLAVAFANPKRTFARDGGAADALNRFITGHMGFISLLQDCMRHASDADRAAVEDIVGYLSREIQKSGDRTETEKRRHNDAFYAAVEGIYGRKFNAVMKDMMATDERFAKFMGTVGGKRVTPTKGRAMQLLVSLLQEGRRVEVEDGDNPGQTKTVWEGGYHDNIVRHHREGQAAEIMGMLTPADMNMIKWLGEWYERNRADLSEVCKSLFGIGVYAELPNYFPVKMKLDRQGLEKGEAVGWTIFPKALTPRVRNGRDFDTSADIFSMWAARMEEGAQWKHHARLGLELRGIFGRAKLQASVIANHGSSVNDLMQGFITDILAGRGAYDRSTAGVEYFSDQIRGWTALCALSCNVGVMVKQTTSIPAFGFEIGLVNTAKYMVNAFTPEGWAAMGRIWDSEQRKTRWQLGSSDAVRAALSRRDAGMLKRLFQAGMIANKLGDVVPALVVGQGIYRDCLERGMSDEDAMAETWSLIERTQQSGRMENLTSIQRRNRIGRIMFQFLSTQQQYLQYEVRALREVIARPDSVKRWGGLGRAILLNHFILTSAYFWMGELYKAILGQEPPEDRLKDWVVSCLLGPYGALFVAGFCCKYTLERFIKGYSIRGGSSMLPMESWLKSQVNDGAKLLEAVFDSDGDTWDSMLDAAGRWMSDFNSLVRDLRKIYRFKIEKEPQK